MTRFQLLVRPDGRALLTTTEAFAAETLEPIRAVLDDWLHGQTGVLVLTETDVIRITELEVDLEARRIHRVPAEVPHG